jgi:hypothetical protein
MWYCVGSWSLYYITIWFFWPFFYYSCYRILIFVILERDVYRMIQKDGLNWTIAFTQTAYLLKLVIPATNALPRLRLNVETKTKRTLHSSRRLSFNELTNAKNLVLHRSYTMYSSGNVDYEIESIFLNHAVYLKYHEADFLICYSTFLFLFSFSLLSRLRFSSESNIMCIWLE